MQQLTQAHPFQLAACARAEHAQRRVGLLQTSVRRDQRNPDRSLIKRATEPLLRVSERKFSRTQFGHVLDGAQIAPGTRGIRANKQMQRPFQPGAGNDAVIKLKRRSAGRSSKR